MIDLYCDFETTGLNPHTCEIVEGYLTYQDKELHFYNKPEVWSDEAIDRLWDGVGRISDERVAFTCLCFKDDPKLKDHYVRVFGRKSDENWFPIYDYKWCYESVQVLRHFNLLSFKEYMLATGEYKEL